MSLNEIAAEIDDVSCFWTNPPLNCRLYPLCTCIYYWPHLLMAVIEGVKKGIRLDEYSQASEARPLHFNASTVPDMNRP